MSAELLVETTVAGSAAILLVLALRRPLRARFGAGVVPLLWALVPFALIAVLLPAAAEPALAPIAATAGAERMAAPAIAAAADTAPSFAPLLRWAWAAGAGATVLLLLLQQRRFVRGLGPLQRRPDGHLQSLATRGLPAVIGLRPRIVLPGDFEQRYDPVERELVLAHEQAHLRRGDLVAALLATLLRALFWFNPLVHLAASRFRHDQELACDADVLRRHPDRRRHYGEAMLKTRLADQPLPLGCHWSGSHPLKERLAMLKLPQPSRARRLAGLVLTAVLGITAAAVAWATQPAGVADVPPGKLQMDLEVRLDGAPAHSVRRVLGPDSPHVERFSHEGQAWVTTWTVRPLADGTFDVSARLERDGEVVGQPRLIARDAAAVAIGQEDDAGKFRGVQIDVRLALGPPAPGTAAVGIVGDVPAYPAAAVAAGEGGTVMLRILVGTDGSAREVRYEPANSTLPEDSALVRSAMATAAKWKLNPAIEDGQPVETWVLVPVRFDPPKADGDA